LAFIAQAGELDNPKKHKRNRNMEALREELLDKGIDDI